MASLCPQLCGLFSVKLASLLLLVGGVAQHDEGGTHIRGELHMLLVGDPGTGNRGSFKHCPRVSASWHPRWHASHATRPLPLSHSSFILPPNPIALPCP